MNIKDIGLLLSATPGEPPLPKDPVAAVQRHIRNRQRRLRAGALAAVLIAAGVTTTVILPVSRGTSGTSRLDVVTAPTPAASEPPPMSAGATLLLIGSQGISSATDAGARIPTRLRSGLVNPSRELLGDLGVIGVRTPAGDQLIYNSWSWTSPAVEAQSSHTNGEMLGTPSIHVYDTATGHDSVLAEHAQSVALSGDGSIAYFQSGQTGYRSGSPLTGQVIVRTSLSASPQQWTTEAARYTVLAWAGRSLLVQLTPAGQEGGGPIYALDGAGQTRVISPAVNSTFLAVSPDGQQILTSEGAIGDPTLQLRTVSNGSTIWSGKISALFPVSNVSSVSPLASWIGDAILLTGSAGTSSALLPLTSTPQGLIAGRAVHISASITPYLTSSAVLSGSSTAVGIGLDAPPTSGSTPSAVHYVVVACELRSGSCSSSSTGQSVYHQQLGIVRNLSRPLPSSASTN